ncbi:MAG: hypothetical protein ACC646_12535, partial [Paracoccaceae bacterium]
TVAGAIKTAVTGLTQEVMSAASGAASTRPAPGSRYARWGGCIVIATLIFLAFLGNEKGDRLVLPIPH